jgi:hypothetical protein
MSQESKKYSQEIRSLIYFIIFLTIIFGYNDKSDVLSINLWLTNLVLVLAIVALISLVYVLGIKLTSKKYGNKAYFKLTDNPKSLKSYIRHILALALTLVSNGLIFFTPLYNIEFKKVRQLNNIYERDREYDQALAFFSGNFFILILLLIFSYFNITLGSMMCVWFIAWNLVPLASQSGTQTFFISRPLYVFSLVFFPLSIMLSISFAPLLSLILALIFAIALFIFYYYMAEYKSY